MKKAIKGHFGALRFTRKLSAVLALLLLTTCAASCNSPSDGGETGDTSAVTEEGGMKGGDVFVMDGQLSEVVYPLKENMVRASRRARQRVRNRFIEHSSLLK